MERFELEGYVVEDLIGFGGTGEVWRAREVTTGETVALKRLRARGAAATERLRREAGLLATLAGPHIIGVRRLVVDDDEAVMVMDFAAGGNLATLLAARGQLPAYEVVTVIAPIAAALAAAHTRDLIHGDLTPANILFTDDGRPLLADFGVARAMKCSTPVVEATAEFLDPVVAAGAQPTTASDVFSLGAVAFTALAGHGLWGTGRTEELIERAARGVRPAVADVVPDAPAAFTDIIERMLAADPADRPDAKAAGAAILRSSAAAPVGLVNAPRPAPAPPTNVVRPARPKPVPVEDEGVTWTPWRRRVVIAGAVAAAMVGAIGVGISLAGNGHGATTTLTDIPTAATSTSTSTAAPVTPTTTRPAAPGDGTGGSARVAPQWFALVSQLDKSRAQAFDDADPTALDSVYVPTAPAYITDTDTLRFLARHGEHAQGFTATVTAVRALSGTATTERLRVVDRLSRYVLVDATGTVVDSGPARPRTAFTMTLAKVDDQWRVATIKPA